MIKSLFNICLAAISQHSIYQDATDLPNICKQRLLEFFSSHDQLFNKKCIQLISSKSFGRYLTQLQFYLDDQITDALLISIAMHNHVLEDIGIIFCDNISDRGIQAITVEQKHLRRLQLRALKNLSSHSLQFVSSSQLQTVDLSSCSQITSDGIFNLVNKNRSIRRLYLNHCKGLCEKALYHIANFLGKSLLVLELDYFRNITNPSKTLLNLSEKCPRIRHLSLCRFFEIESFDDEFPEYRIAGAELRDVDLYGNYFLTLPTLPSTVRQIRLSICGDEDVYDLISRLQSLPKLSEINLQLSSRDQSNHSMEIANNFLQTFLPYFGEKIVRLQISLSRLFDTVFRHLMESLPNLTELALNVKHINNKILRLSFTGEEGKLGSRLISLKLCRMQVTYRALFAIARGAKSITDIETSHMPCVDDRFLAILANNCLRLNNVNINGCRFVGDRGLESLARKCSLREVRIRGTSCTDKSIYVLAQFCPDLEWISHADYTGRPKFSDQALQCLRDSCVQRVIC